MSKKIESIRVTSKQKSSRKSAGSWVEADASILYCFSEYLCLQIEDRDKQGRVFDLMLTRRNLLDLLSEMESVSEEEQKKRQEKYMMRTFETDT